MSLSLTEKPIFPFESAAKKWQFVQCVQVQGAGPEVNVLIVDDSAAIRKILQRVLNQANVPMAEVFEAGDGVEALKVLKAQKVDLILSDINMPNMDGLQLLSEMRCVPAWKDVPVLIISTEGSQSKVMDAIQLGASGYVRKPFTAEQIKEKLAGIL
jgi:two-component system, chemotaxis family, chemotaxis protein CheY